MMPCRPDSVNRVFCLKTYWDSFKSGLRMRVRGPGASPLTCHALLSSLRTDAVPQTHVAHASGTRPRQNRRNIGGTQPPQMEESEHEFIISRRPKDRIEAAAFLVAGSHDTESGMRRHPALHEQAVTVSPCYPFPNDQRNIISLHVLEITYTQSVFLARTRPRLYK